MILERIHHLQVPIFSFQCAVRAALKGRVLIIEGIEKAERNVLPILNNLLENREMNLDDGRLLVSAEKFDFLLKVNNHHHLVIFNLIFRFYFFRTILKLN